MSREMKNSGIPWVGDIPSHWRVETIGSCIKEVNEPNSDLSEDNSLQFKMGTIISKKYGDSKYNPESLEAYNKVKEGDIIINGLNLSFDFISLRVGCVEEKGVITSAYLAVRPLPFIDSHFLNYLFKGYDYCKALHSMGRGLRATLGYKEFRKYSVIFPEFEEQKAITDFLDKKCNEIDDLISLQDKIIEELIAYKQSVITEAVCRGLNPNVPRKDSGIVWIGQIPEGWDVSRVGLHYSIILGKMLCDKPIENGVFAPYYCAANVHFDGITSGELKKMWYSLEETEKYRVRNGDLLVVEGGAGAGGCAIVNSIEGDTFIQNSIMIVRSSSHEVRFLKYHIERLVSQGYIDFVCNKATIPHFTKDKLSQVPYAFPSKAEQQAIAEFLDKKCTEIDTLISLKQSKIEALKEYKKSIIYEFVTGKKEVPYGE